MQDRSKFMGLAAGFMKQQHGIDVQIMGEADTSTDSRATQRFFCTARDGLSDEQQAAFGGFCAGWFAAFGED